MNTKYNKVYGLCESLGISKGKLTDEYLFTIHATDLFFYKQNIGTMDIKTGFVDGAGDGGIDFIYSDNEILYFYHLLNHRKHSKKMILTFVNTHHISYYQNL